jgi:predicted nuclease of restriction endonuclease-like (RecB) superfamily
MPDLSTPPSAEYGDIHTSIIKVLEAARSAAARSVNTLMTASYWEIGRRIVEFEQGGKERAEYGEALIKRLADDLTRRFGRGFSRQNLWQMRQFYLCWPIPQTVSGESQGRALSAISARFPLPWSAYVRLLSVKNEAARAFYETEALRCGWSVRQLNRQISSQFYERIALSRNKAALLKQAEQPASADDLITPEEAIKDPFVLEFLALKDEYSESDLEEALIQRLADFLLELGDEDGKAGSHWNIGLTYYDMSDLAKAEEHLSIAVQIAEAIDHPLLEKYRKGLKQVRAARRG